MFRCLCANCWWWFASIDPDGEEELVEQEELPLEFLSLLPFMLVLLLLPWPWPIPAAELFLLLDRDPLAGAPLCGGGEGNRETRSPFAST